ncbi:alanine racemase [bacterium]|nr:alanine racemase [bacterium]
MARLEMYRDRLKHNYKQLQKLFTKNKINWAVTTKVLCGNKMFLQEVLDLQPKQICESRVSNLKAIKSLDPEIETIYIKPPSRNAIASVVKYADISLNTELSNIKLLAKEARKQKRVHKIIIMIEMGDLREGVMGNDVIQFYEKTFKLKGIKVIGIGTNLNCLFGVMPSHDKLVQLGLYRQIIELKFKRKLPIISGGSTVTIPLIYRKQLPQSVNHFRVGEALFFGADLFDKKTLPGFFPNVFQLFSEIIELYEKPIVPLGELDEDPRGETHEVNPEDYGKKSYRAILDIGTLDVNPEYLTPEDPDLEIVKASSDMLVVELKKGKQNYVLGSIVRFDIKYMGVLSLMNSRYIEKKVI